MLEKSSSLSTPPRPRLAVTEAAAASEAFDAGTEVDPEVGAREAVLAQTRAEIQTSDNWVLDINICNLLFEFR